jgi:hypothetical protein
MATSFCQTPNGGTCETKLASGATCDANNTGVYSFVDNQCADGTSCYQLTGQANPTCQKLGANADGCVKTSSLNDTCKIGFVCNVVSGSEGTCGPWVADAQSCDPNEHSCTASQTLSCIVDNGDAGAATTCQPLRSFGASCFPGFEDGLCAASDVPGSTYCAPAGSSGVCAPKCF